MDSLISSIGLQIRILRKSKNLSQEELAFKAGVHPTYIGQVERGEKNLTISSLHQITIALEISLDDFFSVIEPNHDSKENLPYQLIIELLQDVNINEQKQLYEIIKQIVNWKKS
ncbi:helix-turn-helix domain-containing protein [Lysinibacillus varians]|uniref:Helix-turn-helix transcriptional regulator n=1 Tax=Lysinibacillus varians TaxID=1145276 RepID=A0ABY2TA08_9BACI|nr:helix-turn-helix transcriptional regulator [Lysinibacillus varians]AHN22799.1 XRE family transcriptional regulator [Lysinibacillus varians]TKI60253.1 helix-turn-helix transcriptional regulator [Lysinibacillus varians]